MNRNESYKDSLPSMIAFFYVITYAANTVTYSGKVFHRLKLQTGQITTFFSEYLSMEGDSNVLCNSFFHCIFNFKDVATHTLRKAVLLVVAMLSQTPGLGKS